MPSDVSVTVAEALADDYASRQLFSVSAEVYMKLSRDRALLRQLAEAARAVVRSQDDETIERLAALLGPAPEPAT